VENGEIAAVVVDGEATLKRVYYYPEEGKLILSPENPAYEPLVFVGSELADIRILGRAVAFQAKLR
jgi:repressor LexA